MNTVAGLLDTAVKEEKVRSMGIKILGGGVFKNSKVSWISLAESVNTLPLGIGQNIGSVICVSTHGKPHLDIIYMGLCLRPYSARQSSLQQ